MNADSAHGRMMNEPPTRVSSTSANTTAVPSQIHGQALRSIPRSKTANMPTNLGRICNEPMTTG